MAGDTIRSLERGLQVLQALHMRPAASLNDMHALTKISKPSLLRVLRTLEQSGWITRRLGDGRYHIAASLTRMAQKRDRYNSVVEAAGPVLERMCQRAAWPSDLMVPAGDHMEIRETTRTRSPFPMVRDRIGHPVPWLVSAVGRAYLAFCPEAERRQIVDMLRKSGKRDDLLAREPKLLDRILAEVRAKGYGTRDPSHTGGGYGGPPVNDGIAAIAVPLTDGRRVYGAINMLWIKTAFSVEEFAARHLADLQAAAAEIVGALRGRPQPRKPR